MSSLTSFTDALDDIVNDSPPMSLASSDSNIACKTTGDIDVIYTKIKDCNNRPAKGTGQQGNYRSIQEIDEKYRDVFTYSYFNLIQSSVIDDALYSDKSIVVCAPTGSGKTVVFEMTIVQLLMELEDRNYNEDFKIIYMAPVKAVCTERLTEWYPKFTKLGLLCIEVTGDTDVDFSLLKPYKIIITTPEKWDVLTRRWRDHRSLVEVVKLFMIDEVHILNDESRGPVLEAVVSRMKTIESSAQAVHRVELLENQLYGSEMTHKTAPSIRFVAVSATVSNPEDVAKWLGTDKKPAVFHQFGDECRPVKLRRIVEGYHCPPGTSIFKFDIILNYKLWPVIQKYHCGKPTLIFCNTRKGVTLTAETLSRELTINFTEEQKSKLIVLSSTIKNKKLQSLIMSGVGCHHAGLLLEERQTIERGFRNRDLPILITTTTLAMGVNLPAHLVIIKNTQQYVNGAYQEYSMSTVLQMIGRAGRPQFDTEATAVIMTRLSDKARYQALVGGCEPLQSYLHKRIPENLNSEAALGTVSDVAQCVQWLSSTFLYVRAARDPKKYLNLPQNSPQHLVTKKIEDLCVIAMNGLASAGLITMDETGCIQSTEAGRLMSIFYLDLNTMKQIMKIEGTESLEQLVALICESHELSDMYLRVDERRCLNALNRNKTAATIRFPMKGKITTRQMKLNCIIQAVLGCLTISDPSLNQEAMKIMRIAERVCKGLVAYVTNQNLISHQPQYYSAVLNCIVLAKCISAHLWENSPFVSKQLKGIGPTFSTLLASAGKINFMLLEESHPRDLERIMNKGAPAGNVLRKQISLLPKYQLSMLPVDDSTVEVQLVLLNQNYLSENVEQLTAGANHKSYIVVGDSDNHILLLTSFCDKDLISVFNGTRTHQVKRILNIAHKIFAHCISSTFVGIDVHTEYLFNNLNPFEESSTTPVKDIIEKQTYITDMFKHRKRNYSGDSTKMQSKEKKRRTNAEMESFNYLKNTFDNASKNIQEQNVGLPFYKNDTKLITHEHENLYKSDNTFDNKADNDINADNYVEVCEDFIDNVKVDEILTKIESEMLMKKSIATKNSALLASKAQKDKTQCSSLTEYQTFAVNKESVTMPCITINPKKRKPYNARSNYSCVELLEKHIDLSDDDDKTFELENNSFMNTIKCHINKYIKETEIKSKTTNNNVELLLYDKNESMIELNKPMTENKSYNSDGEDVLYVTRKLSPDKQRQVSNANSKTVETTVLDSITSAVARENVCLADDECTTSTGEAILFPVCELYPNSENKGIKDVEVKSEDKNRAPLLGDKDGNIAHYDRRWIEKICTASNDIDNLRLTQNLDDYELKKIGTTKDNKFCSSNYTGIVKEVKLPDFPSIVQDQNIDEEGTKTPPKDDQYKILKTKQIYSSQILKKDLNKLIPTTHNYNKHTKRPLISYIPKDIFHSNAIKTNLNELGMFNETIILPKKLYAIDNNQDKISEDQTQKPSAIAIQDLNSIPYSFTNITNAIIENISMDHDKHANSIIKESFNESAIVLKKDMNKTDIPRILVNSTDSSHDRIIVQATQSEVSSSHLSVNWSSNRASTGYNGENLQETRSIHVVQNVKVNLNITEIISGIECVNENVANKFPFKSKSIADDIKIQKPINLSFNNIRNNNQNIGNTKITPKDFNKKITKISNYDNLPSCKSTAEILCNTPCAESDIQKQSDHNDWRKSIDDKSFCDTNDTKNKKSECVNTSEENLESMPKIHEISNSLNCDIIKPKDDIQSILQKYSTIVRKNGVNGQTPSHSTSIRNMPNKSNKIPFIKLRNRSSISDIRKIQVTFPETIIDCDNQSLEQQSSVKNRIQLNHFASCGNENPTFRNIICDNFIDTDPVEVHNDFSDTDPVEVHNDFSDTDPVEVHNDFSDTDLGQVHKPVDLESDPDYKMDLSLFDPKLLLQSTVDIEDEIIPPPPQFRDDSAKTDICNEVDNYFNTVNNYSDIQGSQFRYNTESIYNNKLEENLYDTNLTPREIETWILPEEDCSTDNSLLSPTKSFIHRNISPCFDLPASSNLPIKARLGQFKFNSKNKLRKWK